MKKYLLLLIGFASLKLFAQENQIDSTSARWRFSAWAEMFFIPGEEDFFNPTFYARHKTLHLEGRYNYEDRNTTSLWAGRRFKFGKPVEFVIVPMAAIVFGNTNGMAPGLETEIMYKKFDFYSESEYLFDFKTQENNFFYLYSELAIRPIKPIRTGIMAQRTKLFESELELQRGIFAEYYFGRCRAGVFYFSPFSSDNFWIASFSVDF
ncbi:hypothetical protein OCK74_15230 [Chitinophagaceae bacterium LB-8]|uniref:DUF2490 domain-containing protein n=1 Tax=Paraflavisolibacter caeni TaxID=2982496 RepID=A0A9X2XXN8_9BACT|nr:hypothetical protein [Paraflavisolibacter caeni]MCU7550472.1 hypothetical protein [Paraflavisolibacter caeni]